MPTKSTSPKTVIALGNFDGVHLGHRKLIEATVKIAKQEDLIPTVWSFATHPSLLLNKPIQGLLLSPEDKKKRLQSLGIRQVILADFSQTASLSPKEFVCKILVEELNASHVVCGFNYTFGKNAAGTPGLLRELLAEHGVSLTVKAPVTFNGQTVSSTWIRSLLEQGEIPKANQLLGEPFSLTAPVEQGKQLGRILGFPTANQTFPQGLAPLKKGVYATLFSFDKKVYPAVTNVGVRPTVDRNGTLNCESHLLGFDGDLYGKTARCSFLRFLREERRFADPETLLLQIRSDVSEVKKYFETIS